MDESQHATPSVPYPGPRAEALQSPASSPGPPLEKVGLERGAGLALSCIWQLSISQPLPVSLIHHRIRAESHIGHLTIDKLYLSPNDSAVFPDKAARKG